MNSRERFLIAMTGGTPDRVPCTPDFSNMIPCRLTGKPFWDIYLNNDPPIWQAYLNAADYFGIDAWFFYGHLAYDYGNTVRTENTIVSRTAERVVQHHHIITPAGDLDAETTYYVGDPPTPSVKPIKDLERDFAKLRHLMRPPLSYDPAPVKAMKAAIDGRYAMGIHVGYPGFQIWMCFTEGGVQPLAYAEADMPELLAEWRELNEKVVLKELEMILDSRMFDYVMLGGSGSVTLSSPELFDKYALPTLQKQTRMCKEAGVPTMLHSCGKERYLIQRCVETTDLNCVNPLEIPPMGDCTLAEMKRLYGSRIALMGNLHTTEVMLKGTVADVERAARQALADAKAGGGFILSTGDQCGRDTPDENIRAMVRICATEGRY